MFSLWWTSPFFYAGCALNVAILFTIFRRGVYHLWPSLVWYCGTSLVFDFAIPATRHHRFGYFYCYWGFTALSALLRMAILNDVVRSFPGGRIYGSQVRWVIGAACAVMAAGAWYIGAHQATNGYKIAVLSIQSLDRCVAFAWATFFVAALAGIWLLRLGWDRAGATVASAVAVKVCSTMISADLMARFGADNHAASNTRAAGAFASMLLLFISSLQSSDLKESLLPHQIFSQHADRNQRPSVKAGAS